VILDLPYQLLIHRRPSTLYNPNLSRKLALKIFKFSQKLVDKVANWQDGKTARWQFLFSRLAVLPFSPLAQLPSAEM
jgi:hypothetical protein